MSIIPVICYNYLQNSNRINECSIYLNTSKKIINSSSKKINSCSKKINSKNDYIINKLRDDIDYARSGIRL